MDDLARRLKSSSLHRSVDVLDVVVTPDDTPVTVSSVPVPLDSAVALEVKFFVFDVGMTQGASGTRHGMLLRGAGGVTVVGNAIIDTLENFSAPVPSITFSFDVPNREIDVVVTGKAGVTLHWHLEVVVTRSA